MTTRADIALSCAVQLGRANAQGTAIVDLEPQIGAEIAEAVRYYNRQPYHLTEARELMLNTEPGRVWHDALTLGERIVPVSDILSIAYAREAYTGLTDRMVRMHYSDFERMQEGSGLRGSPHGYALYGGEIGIYPVPDLVYPITFSANVKALVPQADDDTSIWFEEAREMIEAAALKRICLKYLRDPQRAQEFAAIEGSASDQLHAEYVRKRATGRIKAHE